MIPGELHVLVERCRAGEGPAWEDLAAWVKTRGRAILGGVDRLGEADREDAVAETLKSLVGVVRRGAIQGASNAEIDAYVCTAIRNRALNILRGRARRREVDARGPGASGPCLDGSPGEDRLDEAPHQFEQAAVAEQLRRAEKVLLSWAAEDRYLLIAKLNGVSARVIQQTLERAPFDFFIAVTTVDSRFHRLRQRLAEQLREP